VLIDPVGIKVEGWIYPFLSAWELPELVATVFHDPMVRPGRWRRPTCRSNTLALLTG
jgi:hypothetical protein